jgi:hypothetical protein
MQASSDLVNLVSLVNRTFMQRCRLPILVISVSMPKTAQHLPATHQTGYQTQRHQ